MARLPPSASVAAPQDGEKLHAPAAARNADHICALLQDHAPKAGHALELASGTGQHIVRFAADLPALHWHPSEIDPVRRASIDAYAAEAALPNIAPALPLDATAPGWGARAHPMDLVVLINLLHLITIAAAHTLITEVGRALGPDGVLMLYGPFRRQGVLTSDGDARFDAELRAADPAIGYKDDLEIAAWLRDAGVVALQIVEMPANNLAFIARKSV